MGWNGSRNGWKQSSPMGRSCSRLSVLTPYRYMAGTYVRVYSRVICRQRRGWYRRCLLMYYVLRTGAFKRGMRGGEACSAKDAPEYTTLMEAHTIAEFIAAVRGKSNKSAPGAIGLSYAELRCCDDDVLGTLSHLCVIYLLNQALFFRPGQKI
jgi:hypothetical protein